MNASRRRVIPITNQMFKVVRPSGLKRSSSREKTNRTLKSPRFAGLAWALWKALRGLISSTKREISGDSSTRYELCRAREKNPIIAHFYWTQAHGHFKGETQQQQRSAIFEDLLFAGLLVVAGDDVVVVASVLQLDVVSHVERRREDLGAGQTLPLVLRRQELHQLGHGRILHDGRVLEWKKWLFKIAPIDTYRVWEWSS